MKRISTLLFVIILSTQVFSQTTDLKYGFRFALGEGMFNNNLGGNTQQGRIAFNLGLASYVQLAKHFAASVDLQLCSKGTRISGKDSTQNGLSITTTDYLRTFRLFYAEIPILARYTYAIKDNLNINAFAGPSINFAVISATESRDGKNSYDSKDINVNTVEYAAIVGLSFNVVNSDTHQYFLDFRYSLPLSPVANIDGKDIKVPYFTLGIGYMY